MSAATWYQGLQNHSATAYQVNLEGRILDDQEPQSNGGGSAPDGDLDAAYALLLAGRRWEHTAYTDRGIQVHQVHMWHIEYIFYLLQIMQ